MNQIEKKQENNIFHKCCYEYLIYLAFPRIRTKQTKKQVRKRRIGLKITLQSFTLIFSLISFFFNFAINLERKRISIFRSFNSKMRKYFKWQIKPRKNYAPQHGKNETLREREIAKYKEKYKWTNLKREQNLVWFGLFFVWSICIFKYIIILFHQK